jgi:Ca-activated chloride channel family protein
MRERSWLVPLVLVCLSAQGCPKPGVETSVDRAAAQERGWRPRGAIDQTAVAWQGTAGAKFKTCPRSQCGCQAPAAGEPPIRGCEAGAIEEELPPPTVLTASDVLAALGGGGGGSATEEDAAGRGPAAGAPGGAYSPVSMPAEMEAAPPPSPGSYSGYAVAAQGSYSYGSGGYGYGSQGCEVPESADYELVVYAAAEGEAAPEESLPPGGLQARKSDGEVAGEFPLKHTEVTAEVSGYIARTEVEQQYENPFAEVIEAVYVFPLPAMAAVNDFVMQIGERKIVGLVRPREEAERIYQEARAAGQTASLLTQERPNIFTQSVANIEPGGAVTIRITYLEKLSYERGRYEYMFPMVVGPRYIPGTPTTGGEGAAVMTRGLAALAKQEPTRTGQAGAQGDGTAGDPTTTTTTTTTTTGGGGWAGPTDRVPDADRITPPVLRPGERSGHDIGLTVKIDAGVPIQNIRAVTHCVDVEVAGEERGTVKLSPADGVPNRDFVLRWSVAGEDTQYGVLAHRGDAGGYLTLMMQPPAAPADAQVTPREITFLLDVSGSQQGTPLAISKEVVRRAMDELRGEDIFNIFYFSSGNGQLWDQARSRTAANVDEARAFLRSLCGGGGTEMLDGIRRALLAEHDPKYLQMFVFFTDGYVGNEDEILRMIKEERGEARFFAFGISSSVNRYLIDGVGEFGGGTSEVVLPSDPEHAGRAVQRLFDLIDSPVLVDVAIDWNGLPVEDVYPAKLPDLFAGQTINLVARYTAAARGTAYIEARVGAEHVRVPVEVDLPDAEPANAALAPIWARWRIEELSKRMVTAGAEDQEALKRQITDLAVEYRLMSQYTAFVAVDGSRVVGDGNPLRVMQPVELPADMSYAGVFGEPPTGVPFEVPAWGLTLQQTESGKIRVGAVTLGSPAAQAGVTAGMTLSTLNGTLVHDLRHLEGLVLQGGATLQVGFDSGVVALPGM